jgi:transcription elongation factor GreA
MPQEAAMHSPAPPRATPPRVTSPRATPTGAARSTTSSRPITAAALEALRAEQERLASDVVTLDAAATPDGMLRLPVADAERRLRAITNLLAVAEVVVDPAVAAVGRRVRIRESDGAEWTCTLVGPGDGDAEHGWVSADAPVGAALLGRRPGEQAEVVAPGGRWTVTVVSIEEATMLPACPPAAPVPTSGTNPPR